MSDHNKVTDVTLNENFNQGRQIWNGNDAILEARIDTLAVLAGFSFFQKFSGSDATSTTNGAKFSISVETEEQLRSGSVQVIINGVYYLSNTDQRQETPETDFYIEGAGSIIVRDLEHDGTIDLLSTDEVGIYFQKEEVPTYP